MSGRAEHCPSALAAATFEFLALTAVGIARGLGCKRKPLTVVITHRRELHSTSQSDYNVITGETLANLMRMDLVRIGNSRGIRIPKPVIEQCGFGDTVQVRVEKDRLVITADRTPRQGWREAFSSAATSAPDPVLLALPPNEFDAEEWNW
jgi:antitoxin MazE